MKDNYLHITFKDGSNPYLMYGTENQVKKEVEKWEENWFLNITKTENGYNAFAFDHYYEVIQKANDKWNIDKVTRNVRTNAYMGNEFICWEDIEDFETEDEANKWLLQHENELL